PGHRARRDDLNWLAGRLAATHPLFQRRGGPADAAELTAAPDQVTLLLDEMDEALRPAALQALGNLAGSAHQPARTPRRSIGPWAVHPADPHPAP
ncbi:MAG: hypothetical protein ACRDTC_15400, partial [Pseudonocardiaceae bacterium]